MYCLKCGKEIKKGEQFCPQCGNSVTDNIGEINNEGGNARSGNNLNKKILAGLILAVSGLVLTLAVLVGMLIQREKNSYEDLEMNGREPAYMVQCMACNGTGKVTCSRCLGSGKQEMLGISGTQIICRGGCYGTGKVDCEYCNGTGWR